MDLYFFIHNSTKIIIADIAMPENVFEEFKFVGYKWLTRAFGFKQRTIPKYIGDLASGLVKTELRDLPTEENVNKTV
jgi:hypothetical protein